MNETKRRMQKAWSVLYKNASVGAYAIGQVIERTKHPQLRRLLKKQMSAYRRQEQAVGLVLRKYGIEKPTGTTLAKLMTRLGIRMHTVYDKSDSNLAKLMVQGTDMGVITLLQTLHDTTENGSLPQSIRSFSNAVLRRENAYMESLKQFL